jgi:hypothetical protein
MMYWCLGFRARVDAPEENRRVPCEDQARMCKQFSTEIISAATCGKLSESMHKRAILVR